METSTQRSTSSSSKRCWSPICWGGWSKTWKAAFPSCQKQSLMLRCRPVRRRTIGECYKRTRQPCWRACLLL